MKNLKLIIALAMILPVFSQQAMAQKKVLLKYNLKKGEKFVSHLNINQDITMQAQGQTITMNQTITTQITTVVKKETADSLVTSNTLDKMTMDQSMFGQELKYDSSDPKTFASGRGKQIGDVLNKMIGKSYDIFMDRLGNIARYELSTLLKGGGKISTSFKSGNNYIIFPNHKVKVGDSWEADIKPMKTDNMKIHMKYTLKKISGKKAYIEINGVITANKLNGQSLTINGTQSGEAVIDIKTGWTISNHMSQDIKMKLEKNGVEIPMEISSTITLTSEKE